MRLRRNIEALGICESLAFIQWLGGSTGSLVLGVEGETQKPVNKLLSGLSKGFAGLSKECGMSVPLRETKDMTLIEADEPLVLRDKERFHNGPEVFDLRNQGDGGTTYTCKSWGGEDTRTSSCPFYLQKLYQSTFIEHLLGADYHGALSFIHPVSAVPVPCAWASQMNKHLNKCIAKWWSVL